MLNKLPREGSKTRLVLDHLLTKKDITIREMEVDPFRLNCPYRVIKNLRDFYGKRILDEFGVSILDEEIVKTNKVIIGGKEQEVTDRFKRYFLEKMEGL